MPDQTLASQAGRTTKRSGVVRALETKFLLFWVGQEQDRCPVALTGTALSAPGVFGSPPAQRQRLLQLGRDWPSRSCSLPRPPSFQGSAIEGTQFQRPCRFAWGEAADSERLCLPLQIRLRPTHPVRKNIARYREVCGDVAVTPAVYKSAVQQRAVIWGQISARRLHPTRLHHGRHGSRQ